MNQEFEEKPRAGGFARMDQRKQREIARKGGMAAHQRGTAHEFTSDEARHAGRKGGQQVSSNRAHMTEIGRLGGRRSAERRRQNAEHRNTARESEPNLVVEEAETAANKDWKGGAEPQNG